MFFYELRCRAWKCGILQRNYKKKNIFRRTMRTITIEKNRFWYLQEKLEQNYITPDWRYSEGKFGAYWVLLPNIYLFQFSFQLSIGNLLSDKQKKMFENPTFFCLTRVSRVNTIWGNHLHISNGVQLLVNISHMCFKYFQW